MELPDKITSDPLLKSIFHFSFLSHFSDTLKIDITFERTQVPAVETTYICQAYEVPADKMYHMIATQPIINNAYVMHHTILYGCPDHVKLGE